MVPIARQERARCNFCGRMRDCKVSGLHDNYEWRVAICEECLSDVFGSARTRRQKSITCFTERLEAQRLAAESAATEIDDLLGKIEDAKISEIPETIERTEAQRLRIKAAMEQIDDILGEIVEANDGDEWPTPEDQESP